MRSKWLSILMLRLHRRREALDFLTTMSAKGASVPLTFAANVVVARALGPERYGIYLTLWSAAVVASGFATFGTTPLLTREIATAKYKRDPARIRALLTWVTEFTGLLTVAFVVGILGWLTVGIAAPDTTWTERVLSSLLVPASVVITVLAGVLGGLSLVAKGQFMGQVLKSILLLAGAAAIVMISARPTVTMMLTVQLASMLISAAFGVWWIAVALSRIEGGAPSPNGPVQAVDRRALMSASASFLATTIAMLIVDRLDVVIVNAFAGPLEAGYFGIASRVAQLAMVGSTTIILWLQPRIAHLAREGNAELERVMVVALRISIAVTLVPVGIGLVAAPQLMSLFGHGFGGVVIPFRLLLIGDLFYGIGAPYYVLITMSGGERTAAIVLWSQCLLILGLSVPLVAAYGAIGGAMAWGVGNIFSTALIAFIGIRRMRKVSSSARRQAGSVLDAAG